MAASAIVAEDQHVVGAADPRDIDAIRHFAVAYLRREQDLDLRAFGVSFDEYFLESSLYSDGKVEQTVQGLIDSGYCYEQDGALWLRTTEFGDDKDRVMRKSEGGYTYFVPDVAYHLDKWQRGFQRVINEQGADHHSTITRVRAGLQALNVGIPKGWPDYVLHQMVTVTRNGEEVKISKRAGSYVTLRDLIDEVGQDATRYFLAARAPSSQLTFDIDLARSRSNDNPVYYIQYAHARICSVMQKLVQGGMTYQQQQGLAHLDMLGNDNEKALLKQLGQYAEVVRNACNCSEPHLIANYLKELAAQYHGFYNNHKVITADARLRDARLCLSLAVRQVIGNGLDLLGVIGAGAYVSDPTIYPAQATQKRAQERLRRPATLAMAGDGPLRRLVAGLSLPPRQPAPGCRQWRRWRRWRTRRNRTGRAGRWGGIQFLHSIATARGYGFHGQAAEPRKNCQQSHRQTMAAVSKQKAAPGYHYYLQAGSFQHREEAEKRRIQLILLDMEADIEKVKHQGKSLVPGAVRPLWFDVTTGQGAEQTQRREH